jgi:hypothetical protein
LPDIVDIRRPKGNLALLGSLHGKDHASGANLKWIQQIINTRLGVDMVQHGAEAQRLDHLEKDEVIDVFTPAGQHLTKSNLAELKELYATTFKGRITLSDRFPQSSFSSTEVSRGQFENVTPISVHKNYPGFKKR